MNLEQSFIKIIERKDKIMSVVFAASAALSACANSRNPVNLATENPKKPAATWTMRPDWLTQESLLTKTPVPIKVTPTPEIKKTPLSVTSIPTGTLIPPTGTLVPKDTDTPTPEAPPEFRKPIIGNTDLSKPFTINVPTDTAKLAAFWGGSESFSIEVPVVVTETQLTDYEQKLMSPHNIPWNSSDPNFRVGLIFQTNNLRPGLTDIMLYAHTGVGKLNEELSLDFLRKMVIYNPDKVVGARLSLGNLNQNMTNLEIVDVKVVTEDTFNHAFGNYEDRADPAWQNVPLFLRFDMLGIDINSAPYNSRDNLITFVGCSGPWYDITSTRFVVTAKVLP